MLNDCMDLLSDWSSAYISTVSSVRSNENNLVQPCDARTTSRVQSVNELGSQVVDLIYLHLDDNPISLTLSSQVQLDTSEQFSLPHQPNDAAVTEHSRASFNSSRQGIERDSGLPRCLRRVSFPIVGDNFDIGIPFMDATMRQPLSDWPQGRIRPDLHLFPFAYIHPRIRSLFLIFNTPFDKEIRNIQKITVFPRASRRYSLDCTFDGQSSVNECLERIEEIRCSRGVSKSQPLRSALEWFTKGALCWYCTSTFRS